MCYLRTQRAERNVPVYTRELEERADKEAARALVNAEQRRAEAQIQAESDLRTEKRALSKEVSAVNLSIAQATKERRAEEAKHKLPHVSTLQNQFLCTRYSPTKGAFELNHVNWLKICKLKPIYFIQIKSSLIRN